MSFKGDNQFGYLWIKQASCFPIPLAVAYAKLTIC